MPLNAEHGALIAVSRQVDLHTSAMWTPRRVEVITQHGCADGCLLRVFG